MHKSYEPLIVSLQIVFLVEAAAIVSMSLKDHKGVGAAHEKTSPKKPASIFPGSIA